MTTTVYCREHWTYDPVRPELPAAFDHTLAGAARPYSLSAGPESSALPTPTRQEGAAVARPHRHVDALLTSLAVVPLLGVAYTVFVVESLPLVWRLWQVRRDPLPDPDPATMLIRAIWGGE